MIWPFKDNGKTQALEAAEQMAREARERREEINRRLDVALAKLGVNKEPAND